MKIPETLRRVLVLGSGAREHAILWKLSQHLDLLLFAAPGNGGTATIADSFDLSIPKLSDCEEKWEQYFENLICKCRLEKIDLVIPSTDSLLVRGVVDRLYQAGILAFGPTKMAAFLTEGSKAENYLLMKEFGIPCPKSQICNSRQEAKQIAVTHKLPLVIKMDGIASGKGVVIAYTIKEAFEIIDDFMASKEYGDAGKKLLIQDFLTGQEVSLLAFSDGWNIVPMVPAHDYKKIYNGDRGQNTGGVGCYSPVPWLAKNTFEEMVKITETMIRGLAAKNHPFVGVIYPGFIITKSGHPKVLEFNCRPGDPETQVILPQLENDLLEVIFACLEGKLNLIDVAWKKDFVYVGVVLCSKGYPTSKNLQMGEFIRILGEIEGNTLIFHAGTIKDSNGNLVTNGGRVLMAVGRGKSFKRAKWEAYLAAGQVWFSGIHYRTDIAEDIV